MKQILWVLMGVLGLLTAQAQTRQVSGKVTGASESELLPGVSILLKGTQRGTTTNTSGTFQMEVTGENPVLIFSYVGYQTKEVALGNQTELNVSLTADNKALDEVVVVGYGTQSKRAVTGAVTSIGYDQYKDRSFSNVTQSLAGKMPGVNITQAQGAPGLSPIIRIRGVNSITAGTNPLFVVDGVPLENFNLNMINPQDIESVEVLKDASSAAIYGSRGSSGVILVTTKQGQAGKTTVSATFEYGIQKVAKQIKLMNAQQYIDYYVAAKNNGWVANGGKATDPNSARTASYRIPDDFINNRQMFGNGTNWQDVMYREAPLRNAQVSVSGGTDKTQFLFSTAYLDQDAVLDNNYYKRLTIRSNIKSAVSKRLTIGANLGITGITDRTEGTQGKSDVISLGLQSTPIYPKYNENGNLGPLDPNSVWNKFVPFNDLVLWHPYSLTRFYHKKNRSFNTLGTAYLEFNILDDLKFRTSINANLFNNRGDSYRVAKQGFGYSSVLDAAATNFSTYSLNWLSENTLNYDKQFGDHKLTALVGYTAQKQRDEYATVGANNFPNDLVETLNAGTVSAGSTIASEWSMLSYLARANYNFKNKYFLTAAVRRDASSRFGRNSRWGTFPSVSAGWLVSDEAFLNDVKAISNLKLRASYGMTGNNQIPNYGAVSLLGSSNYVSNGAIANGLRNTNIANPDLRWEKNNQFDIGIDLGLFNNRLNITADYYNTVTKDMLLNLPVPDITGFSSQLTNIGQMRNRGFELAINSKNVVGNFSWTTDLNFSLNRNKVLKLGPSGAPIIYTEYVVNVKTEIGQPISNFYGYVFDGVFKNQAEIDAYAHDASTTPGDPRIRDVNGDGRITTDDQTTIGNYQPDFIAGMTNTFSYKGFDLSFLLQGSYGGEIVNQNIRYLGIWNAGRNFYEDLTNYWRSESDPGDGKHFKPTVSPKGLQEKFSSYWVEDASFLRVKNIRVSYALPTSLLQKTPVRSARVYVNAENVFLFSKYRNIDPENTTYRPTNYNSISTETGTIGSTGNNSFPSGSMIGVDYGSYPLPRVITFGIRADF